MQRCAAACVVPLARKALVSVYCANGSDVRSVMLCQCYVRNVLMLIIIFCSFATRSLSGVIQPCEFVQFVVCFESMISFLCRAMWHFVCVRLSLWLAAFALAACIVVSLSLHILRWHDVSFSFMVVLCV